MSEKNKIDALLDKLKQNERDIKRAIEKSIELKQWQFQFTISEGKITFEQSIRQMHLGKKISAFEYIKNAELGTLITSPVIYAMIFPLIFLDLTITLYQHICFRVYKIPRVQRADYIVVDRQYLSYLNIIEKLNCMYCGYGNGVAAYALEIIARTEQYWCPIKHAKNISFNMPALRNL